MEVEFMLFLLSVGFALITVYQLNRFINYEKLFDWVIGGVLLLISVVVFIFTMAGLFYQMNSQLVILLMQVVVLGVVFLATWKFKGRLHPTPKWDKDAFRLKGFPVVLLIFAGIIVLALVLNLVYVTMIPPSNNDSLMIHLARILMWRQNGSWLPWPTPATWQLTFPFNGEILAYWSLLFLERETLLAFFPLLTGVLTAALIYQSGVEQFGNQKISLLAALLWLTFPVVQLNLSSSRHDHISTFMLMSAFFFFLRQMKTKSRANLLFIGLSLALSVGTNFAVAAYLLGFGLIILVAWLVLKKLDTSSVLRILAYGLISFLLFSAPIFISNYLNFGSLLGQDALTMTSQESIEEGTSVSHLLLMNGRWGYQLLDCNGWPDPIYGYCHKAKFRIFEWVSSISNITLEGEKSVLKGHQFYYSTDYRASEDEAWFGTLGGLSFFGMFIYSFVAAIRRKDMFFLAVVAFIITMPISLAFLRVGWTPYDGRYFVFMQAIFCIVLVDFLSNRKAWLNTTAVYSISILAMLFLYVILAKNPAKTIFGDNPFYERDRFYLLTKQTSFTREKIYLVDESVPEDAVLGLATKTSNLYEYGLFGEHFSRTIVPVFPIEKLCDVEWLDETGIEYLMSDADETINLPCLRDNFSYLDSRRNWILYTRN